MSRKKFKLRKVKNGTKIIAPKNIDKVKIIKLFDNEKSQLVLQCDKNHSCISKENLNEGSLLILDNGTIIIGKGDISVDEVLDLTERMIELYNTVEFNPSQLSLIDEFVEVVLELLLYSANMSVSDDLNDISKLIKIIELIENSELPQLEEIDYIDKVLHNKLKEVKVSEYREINNSLLIKLKNGNILIVPESNGHIDEIITEICASLKTPQENNIFEPTNDINQPDYFQYQEPESISKDDVPQKELPDEIKEALSKVFE